MKGALTIRFVESGFWKAGPWSLGDGLVEIFMEVHTKVSLACMAKLFPDVMRRSFSSELVQGASCPHRPSFSWVRSPLLLFLWFLQKESPLFNTTSFPFIPVFPSQSSSTCPFPLVQGGYLSYQSSHQSGWGKLGSRVWVWVCQALGSTLRCWQPSPLCCSCAESVLFLRPFCETFGHKVVLGNILGPFKEFSLRVLSIRAPRPGLWAFNTKWAGTSDFRPHNV